MTTSNSNHTWTGRLPHLPTPVKYLLLTFLAIVGFGYLIAVLNMYHTHSMADAKPGLTLNDVRAVYSGLEVTRRAGDDIPSHMLTMLRGSMRQYIDDDEDFTILETWLKKGAPEDKLNEGDSGKTPARVIIRNCLRCHAQTGGEEIGLKAPFGPDDLTVDYDLMKPLLPGNLRPAYQTVRSGPQYTMPRLVLISHMHMLTIPMFSLAVGLLFSMTRFPARIRNILTPLPMFALLIDFAGWWLARLSDGFIHFIVLGGAIFGLAFAIQIVATAVDLWRPASPIIGEASSN